MQATGINPKSNLVEVIERTKMAMQNGVVRYNIGTEEPLGTVDKNLSVSMNYWGFNPSIFSEIEKGLYDFIRQNVNNPTAEYYIPNIVSDMIASRKMDVRVISTDDNWFGVTYKQDKLIAVNAINNYISNGVYPKDLWD